MMLPPIASDEAEDRERHRMFSWPTDAAGDPIDNAADLRAWLDEENITLDEFRETAIFQHMRTWEFDGALLMPWLADL